MPCINVGNQIAAIFPSNIPRSRRVVKQFAVHDPRELPEYTIVHADVTWQLGFVVYPKPEFFNLLCDGHHLMHAVLETASIERYIAEKNTYLSEHCILIRSLQYVSVFRYTTYTSARQPNGTSCSGVDLTSSLYHIANV